MRESDIIKLFSEVHGTNSYAADSEIIKTSDGFELFSIDGFSETEDFFMTTPPELIGRNMAIAASSDLLACGVKPEILLQSWNIDESKDENYYRAVACGIESVLRHYNAKCIGGDIGLSKPWSWTASVQAQSKTPPVTRIASRRIPFDLYISGGMGLANLAVFLNLPSPEFNLKNPVPPEALFATDSSGGFFDALENFRRVNLGMTLLFDASKVISSKLFDLWPEHFDPVFSLIGGVGEYELVFAVPRAMKTDGIKIGEGDFSANKENDFSWTYNEKLKGRMKSAPPDYRNIPPADWFAETKNYFREMIAP